MKDSSSFFKNDGDLMDIELPIANFPPSLPHPYNRHVCHGMGRQSGRSVFGSRAEVTLREILRWNGGGSGVFAGRDEEEGEGRERYRRSDG